MEYFNNQKDNTNHNFIEHQVINDSNKKDVQIYILKEFKKVLSLYIDSKLPSSDSLNGDLMFRLNKRL